MAETDDPLVLSGDRIVPAANHQGSVRRWRCLECETVVSDVATCLDVDCGDVA